MSNIEYLRQLHLEKDSIPRYGVLFLRKGPRVSDDKIYIKCKKPKEPTIKKCKRPSYAVFTMIRRPSVKTDHKMQEAKGIFNHHAYNVRVALYQQRFKVVWFLVPSAA